MFMLQMLGQVTWVGKTSISIRKTHIGFKTSNILPWQNICCSSMIGQVAYKEYFRELCLLDIYLGVGG